MSSLNQYIDLYKSAGAAICANSADALNALRPAALDALKRFERLPDKKDEGYSRTSLEDIFAPDYGINASRLPYAVDVAESFKCDVPYVSTLLGVVVNDEFRPTDTLLKNCPEGVIVASLASVAREYPELVEPYLGRLSSNQDAATSLNTLLAQDGVMIYVPAGLQLERPIQLVNIFNADLNLLSMRRVLIVVENQASAKLLMCDHTQRADYDYLSSQVVEVFLGENAAFDYCDVEESSDRTRRINQIYINQQRDSRLRLNMSTLSCGHTRNELYITLQGSGCETLVDGMAIASDSQIIDNSSLLKHNVGHCHSNQKFKYILDDKAQGAFQGLVYVAQDAVKTEAYQANNNILASESARMHSAPQLEIYCDDVKCSHGSATGQLDERQLFYMRSRGIDLDQARMMLMQAFMSDIIDSLPIEGLRDRMRHLIDRRLRGESAACGDCSIPCKN